MKNIKIIRKKPLFVRDIYIYIDDVIVKIKCYEKRGKKGEYRIIVPDSL